MYLILESGQIFHGRSFGYQLSDMNDTSNTSDPSNESPVGEVVFQTGMIGYSEALTDPSYRSQILVLTYPIIGNYGVPDFQKKDIYGLPEFFESNQIHPSALVVGEAVDEYSHFQATQSLSEWLITQKIPGIQGIDTRALTKILRNGTVRGQLRTTLPQTKLNLALNTTVAVNLVSQVSTSEVRVFEPKSKPSSSESKPKTVLIVDCGVKAQQIKMFLKRNYRVKLVPWDYDFLLDVEFDYLFISNGPGDPQDCQILIDRLRQYLQLPDEQMKPVFGICLGHQLISLAAGAKTYKMKYGNRGHNIPCRLTNSNRCYITSQNHGYAVDPMSFPKTEPKIWQTLFTNLNDGSNEGMIHLSKPIFSVQFHPEARAGPQDTEFLFDYFLDQKLNLLRNPPMPELMSSSSSSPIPVKKVLIIGSGGLAIGQSGEFDYSGTQAIKAYREAGLNIILINPNIATVQTSTDFVDKVYYLPIMAEWVTEVIKLEHPDSVTFSFGGQTALNCGLALYRSGILTQYQVRVLGTPLESVILTEDRQLFKERLDSIQEPTVNSQTTTDRKKAVQIAESIGYPVLIRAAYALGGLGSGFANNRKELIPLLDKAFAFSDQVIIDQSLRGWKELEYEVVRDQYNNCICVCNMENIDPLGIHTGESIVVAPSQTLDDHDYQMLRSTAIKVISNLEIVGECNIQFALDPQSRQYYVIEVNARLSRSSALASKATGYPLAYVAAKLSLGMCLADLKNAVTSLTEPSLVEPSLTEPSSQSVHTTACFEPSLDYCVVKVPRWDLDKFPLVDRRLDSAMKSIGESMGIGRSFEEAFQKALRMANDNRLGFYPRTNSINMSELYLALEFATDQRMNDLATFMYQLLFIKANKQSVDFTIKKAYQLTHIDPWFLAKFSKILHIHWLLNSKDVAPTWLITMAKQHGFSDRQIAEIRQTTELVIRNQRQADKIFPIVKQIDTVAGEFPCQTNYLYLTYVTGLVQQSLDTPATNWSDIKFNNQSVMVLGSGVYKIGSSVEFDWCTVNCIRELRKQGHSTIMVNCNPETVSTDYDEADKLYFEELSFESVMDIYQMETPKLGVILSMGGQIPNNIAMSLHRQNVPIIGTSPEMIDNAENRYKFSRMLDKLNIDQPRWRDLTSIEEATEFCHQVEYPCLIRPSYVLSGAAMNVAYSDEDLLEYLNTATLVSKEHPVVISKFIMDAKEIEVDAVAQKGQVILSAISEHVENAGVHSGDATLIHPAQDLTDETVSRIQTIVRDIARSLEINGPFNMQLIAKDDHIKVIECNLRVSRTFPFVSKTQDRNLVSLATQAMMGYSLTTMSHLSSQTPMTSLSSMSSQASLSSMSPQALLANNRIGVKVPTFSFSRLKGADFTLGVDMVSTGEVACFGRSTAEAYYKGIQASTVKLPAIGSKILLSIGAYKQKREFLPMVQQLQKMGFQLYGTSGTSDFYSEKAIQIQELPLNSQQTENRENLLAYLADKQFQLFINTSRKNKMLIDGQQRKHRQASGYLLRRTAIDNSISITTDIKTAKLLVKALLYANDLTSASQANPSDLLPQERTSASQANPKDLLPQERTSKFSVDRSIDCFSNQKLVRLPGLIDVHVHMREPGAEDKEDWSSGTKSALAGGITQICAMPNTNPAVVDKASFELVSQIAKTKAHCDYAIFVGANNQNMQTISELASVSAGLKMYLNQTFGLASLCEVSHSSHKQKEVSRTSQSEVSNSSHKQLLLDKTTDWLAHLTNWKKVQNRPLCVHAEGQTLAAILHLASITQCPIHVCHVSSREEIEIIKASKLAGQAVTCEVAPHHLFLEQSQILAPYSTVKPPLMTTDDQEALWQNLEYIDCFATDHAPHLKSEKESHHCPGFPGLESALPLLLTAVNKGRLTVADIILRYHDNPKRIFNLPSQPETYIEVDLNQKWNLPIRPAFSKADWSPFADWPVVGKVQRVVLRGQLVYLDGSILNQPGDGKNVRSDISGSASPLSPSSLQSLPSLSPQSPPSPPSPLLQQSSGLQPNSRLLQQSQTQPLSSRLQLSSTLQQSNPLKTLKHIISVESFNRDMLKYLFDRSDQLRQLVKTHGVLDLLSHRVLGLLFYEPSTRTRASFATAMKRLGGQVVEILADQNSSTIKGESFSDSVRTMASYTDALVVRSTQADNLSEIIKTGHQKPLINAGNGIGEHPTQALLDVYTMRRERGSLTGLTIALVGDLKFGRTTHSLAKLLALYQVRLFYFSPSGLEMPDSVVNYIKQFGVEQQVITNLEANLDRIDVLYMTRIQKERHKRGPISLIEENYNKYNIGATTIAKAKDNLVIMHPLPRTNEINPEIDNDPRVAYFRQMENGMYLRMALLESLLS